MRISGFAFLRLWLIGSGLWVHVYSYIVLFMDSHLCVDVYAYIILGLWVGVYGVMFLCLYVCHIHCVVENYRAPLFLRVYAFTLKHLRLSV